MFFRYGMKNKALADKTRYLEDSPEGVSEMSNAIEDKRAFSLGISYGEAQRRSIRKLCKNNSLIEFAAAYIIDYRNRIIIFRNRI